jgi:hypothetical protein
MVSIDRRLYEYDIEWLLCDAPALLGERSIAASNFGAIERGGASPSISDTWPYHEQYMHSIPHVDRARRLTRVWDALPARHQATLRARYITRRYWPLGAQTFLSQELVGVALYYAADREALLDACTRAGQKQAQKVILEARKLAFEAIRDAHQAWRDAKKRLDAERKTKAQERAEKVETFIREELE